MSICLSLLESFFFFPLDAIHLRGSVLSAASLKEKREHLVLAARKTAAFCKNWRSHAVSSTGAVKQVMHGGELEKLCGHKLSFFPWSFAFHT